MATYTKQTSVPLWHYQCPECGVGDEEAGHLHPTEALYCEICLEDQRPVRLRRWPAEDGSASGTLPG